MHPFPIQSGTNERHKLRNRPLPIALADYIETTDLPQAQLPDEYRYASLPLCIIDAVFSIGVRYETTRATVERFCRNTGWSKFAESREGRGAGTNSIKELLKLYEGLSCEELAVSLFGNRQRTSAKSGILKADAVRLFAAALREAKIESFADLTPSSIELAEALVLNLPGQSSGISFDYFQMLAGNDNLVKPDRMVQRYVAHAVGMPSDPSPRLTGALVRLAARELSSRGHDWSPLSLDYAIWVRQRSASKASADPIRR